MTYAVTSSHAEPLTRCDVIILPMTSLAHCVKARSLQLSRHVERSVSHDAGISRFPGHTQSVLATKVRAVHCTSRDPQSKAKESIKKTRSHLQH